MVPVLSPPRILILFHRRTSRVSDFMRQLCVQLAITSSKAQINPERYIIRECDTSFESIRLQQIHGSISKTIESHIEESFCVRKGAGFAFSPKHLKELLQFAVDHFCRGYREQLDLFHAARLGRPLSQDLGLHIGKFLSISRHTESENIELVASALELDAHPPQMHR